MLLLMIAHVTLSFVQGADDFARGWEEGAANNSTLSWSEFLFGILGLATVGAFILSFACFVRFILNVNRNEVFVWDNVWCLRITAIGLSFGVLVFSAYTIIEGANVIEAFEEDMAILIFAVFNLIVAEAFAVGLKLKEEQELTI
jgi:hypothetical protein